MSMNRVFGDLIAPKNTNTEVPAAEPVAQAVPDIHDDITAKTPIESAPEMPAAPTGSANSVLVEQVITAAENTAAEANKPVDVINLIDICQSFPTANGEEFKLFDHFNLDIEDFEGQGQFISFMGQSGCGKSQLCKLMSGLSTCEHGTVKIYGKEMREDQSFPMVFQQYSSFPWMTVLENVELPMKLAGVDEKTRRERAMQLLDLVGLTGQESKWAQYPTLSGGQLQRVSLARNLAANAQIMFLDEATSALDIKSKRQMQDVLLDIYYSAEVDPTIINVSHDISECVYLSNRIYIFKANPCQIYKVIDVDLQCERRTPEVRQTPIFNQYVKEIEAIMDEITAQS